MLKTLSPLWSQTLVCMFTIKTHTKPHRESTLTGHVGGRERCSKLGRTERFALRQRTQDLPVLWLNLYFSVCMYACMYVCMYVIATSSQTCSIWFGSDQSNSFDLFLHFHIRLYIHNYVTNFMELSRYWEAANCAVTQELLSILWSLKFHYRVHKSAPLVPILCQIDSVHTNPSYLRSILILSTHLYFGLPSGLFLSGFPTSILYAFLFSPFVPVSFSLT
jgi:hypothetical protein